jgi:hypothetical protein
MEDWDAVLVERNVQLARNQTRVTHLLASHCTALAIAALLKKACVK